jgi:cysteinyl-tRNA synthetase
MALVVHNTLSRTRERFEPADPQCVTMYVCGPTVYNYAHIGNARPPVVFDVLARLLRRSYNLVYARNVTDVDDKINAAAQSEGVEIGAIAKRYAAAYQSDMRALGVAPPDIEPFVTAHIPQIVAMIAKLVETGHAYAAEGHVLFAVPTFAEYGKLSGRAPEDLIAGARVEVAPYKRDPADFVLWKPSPPEIVGWPSPWGRGRPGWHIECSTMSAVHLGETIDIHGGGVDLVFPHHENEVAQSVCAHGGKPYARYWLHNGLVNVEGEKMAKSLGNVLLVRDLLQAHASETLRLALLSAHYRQPLDWTAQLVAESQQKLDRMYGALRDAGLRGELAAAPAAPPPAGVLAALEDDLNTPLAVAELFGTVRAANRETDPARRRALAEQLRAGAWLLGVLQRDPVEWFTASATAVPSGAAAAANAGAANASAADAADGALDPAAIDSLLARREALRRERKYREADGIRDELAAHGIVIEDVAGGARWRRSR